MSYNFKSEEEVKEFIKNLGIEYRFGCYSEKNPEVCHLLGDYFEAIDKDFPKASKIYKSNCDDYNYGKSCYKYGTYCLLGKGSKKEDYKNAYKYLDKACQLGEANACLNQGLMLITNNEATGVEQQILKGFSLLEKACLSKNANACYYIAGMYISGIRKPNITIKPGEDMNKNAYEVPKNMEEAYRFTKLGCELGNVYCCANLSLMYRKGEGVEKSEELANKYRKIAMEMQSELSTQKTLTFQEGLMN